MLSLVVVSLLSLGISADMLLMLLSVSLFFVLLSPLSMGVDVVGAVLQVVVCFLCLF